ncbi:MAG: hypothetical protein V8Q32_01540 [Anaerotignum faecicola]
MEADLTTRTSATDPPDRDGGPGTSIAKYRFHTDAPVLALFRKNIPWTEEIRGKRPCDRGKI